MSLLEREAEIAAVDAAFASARAGTGTLLLIEGPAGIGKTSLLELARQQWALAHGARVQLARGSALEREIAHGVVRQLLGPALRAGPPGHRARLLDGALWLATPDVVPAKRTAPPGPDQAATDQRAQVLHALYWVTADLAADAPLLLAIDDAQWADAASLRFLLYLANRLDGVPVVVLLTIRSGEITEQAEALAELRALPWARVLRPAPLSAEAVEVLARERLAAEPEPAFIVACHEATGGVPFLLTELLLGLSSDGVVPSAAAAESVPRVTSATVGHATVLRLSRLAPAATAVAQSVAILDRHADLRHIAQLAGLEDEEVLLGHDALVGANVLRPGRPMEFVHPIVRASIYEAIPGGRRALMHAAAARMLVDEGADAEQAAAHILLTEPGQRGSVVEPLSAAARSALDRGVPESAISYLRRALLEPAERDTRARLLFELGTAEDLTRAPEAVAHLEEAIGSAREPALRAAIVAQLAPAVGYQGRWRDAAELLRGASDELGDDRVDLVAALEAAWAAVTAHDPELVDEFDREKPALGELMARAGPAGRPLALVLAGLTSIRGEDLGDVVPLVERGLDGGRFLAEAGSQSWTLMMAGTALVLVGELDMAARLADEMLENARRTGSIFGFSAASTLRAKVSTRAGDLVSAAADLRAAVTTSEAHGLFARTVGTLHDCVDTIIERSDLADLESTLESVPLAPGLDSTGFDAMLREARGRLRLARGRSGAAVEELSGCGRIMESLRWRNPADSQWRSALALALPPQMREEAAGLAAEELALARATGLFRAEGVALRAAGLVAGGEHGIELLQASLDILERSPAPLERARTLVALGGALRRANRRAEARDPLRIGLDLAHRCGADRLADRAEEELRLTGAKPRRRAVSGLDALTPNELRVARQAASGMGNRDIAQSLFVTRKTVETQLSTVYQKLGIRGRDELTLLIASETAPG